MGGDGVVVVLFTDRVRCDKHLKALGLCCHGHEIGFRLLQRGLRAVQRGNVRCGIDLIETLPGLDLAAFLELALQHDAVDAGANLRHKERGSSTGKLGRDRHVARMYCHD